MSMAVDQSLNLKAGAVIQGKYEIVRCLGAGSMGMVYLVKHLELQGRMLAMKVLFSDVAKDEVHSARFRNEIVASYEINHPHVVRAYDFFREDDLVAYTMEYISGGDLADKLNEDDLIPIDQSISMLEQMASGVEAIHRSGIIHRDLKPENILLTDEGFVKITDFGIAKNMKGPRLTDHGGIVGTFAYVSPEYLESGNVDIRSDIYSIGVLAYEMVAGVAPYNAKNVIEEMHLKLTTDPVSPSRLRSECPEELSAVVLKALSRNPDQRHQTARELRIAFSKLGDNATRSYTGIHPRSYNKKQDDVESPKPKVLDNDVARMISGLKNSLEERAFLSGYENDLSEFGEGKKVIDSNSTVSVSDDNLNVNTSQVASLRNTASPMNYSKAPVSISGSKLSAEKLKELKNDLSGREYNLGGFSIELVFEYAGYLLVSLVGILSGLILIDWWSPTGIPEAIDRLTSIFK